MRVLVASVCVGVLGLSSWAAAGGVPVTISVRPFERPGYVSTHVLSGRVSSGAGGEVVTVLAQVCPRSFETSVAGANTHPGGVWETSALAPRTAVTYRARWDGRYSEPVKVWPPLPVTAKWAGQTSLTILVDTSGALQNLRGKPIALQRQDAATFRWLPYRRARLQVDRSSSAAFQYKATFARVGRGVRVRVSIPRETAVPCFQPHTTAAIRR